MVNYLETKPNLCSQCIYFSKTADNMGICRRYPPEIIDGQTRYPVVRTDTLACGEGERSLPEMRELKG